MIYENTPSQTFNILLPRLDELMIKINIKKTAFLLKSFN
jgi:hypothetical protein